VRNTVKGVVRDASGGLSSVRLHAYRAILTIGIVIMGTVGLVNLFFPFSSQGTSLAIMPFVTVGITSLALWRAREPERMARDAPLVAVAALLLYLGALSLNGAVSLPFLLAGVIVSYLVIDVRPARLLTAGYLTASLVGIATFGTSPTSFRIVAVSIGLIVALDVVARGIDELTRRLHRDNATLHGENTRLGGAVRDRTRALLRSQDALTVAMASLVERRSDELAHHTSRVGRQMRILARAYLEHLGRNPDLERDWLDDLARAAPLHDIGKIGVPDAILNKRGTLTPEEFVAMQAHTRIGRDVLDDVLEQVGSPVGFLVAARELVYGHHERWDGSGYPEGIAGTAIPLSARLMAVVDVYDALVHERVYKSAMTHEEAYAVIVKESGTHFDPDVVKAFEACAARIQATLHRTHRTA